MIEALTVCASVVIKDQFLKDKDKGLMSEDKDEGLKSEGTRTRA